MTDKQRRLIDILKEMFQLDQSDLDFGIYRIMNAKADEIRAFLEKDLVGSIKDAFSASGSNPLQAELDDAIASARSLGVDPETIPKVQELRAKLSGTSDATALENDVYSHLATFFSRYYKDGDFVSLRRYKKDTYAIPYEGEEVKLYWTNSDQYYIKTSEYFKDYTFKVADKTVHFKLIDADTESNNNKASSDKERRFVIYEEKPVEEIDGELYIYFEYNDDIENASTLKLEESLSKIKTFKSIAKKIIVFLTQLEEFQKSLWLKKKFIIETNYCITLDKIDEKYYEEILSCDAQLEEWVNLFDVKVESLDDLKSEPYLVLDTKFFDADFKNRLLAEFDDLDEEIDGVLINSENFGALNLLQERYREQVRTVYIDPPYNTGEDGFLYQDSFQNSSWLTFIENRIGSTNHFLNKDGSLWISIDDNEAYYAKVLCDFLFTKQSFIAANVWQKSYSRENREAIGDVHEYIFTYAKTPSNFKNIRNKVPLTKELSKVYRNPTNDPRGRWRTIPLTAQGGHATKDQFYEIKAPGGKVFTPPEGRCWGIAEETYKKYLKEGRIYFGKDNNSQPNLIRYLSEVEGMTPWTWLSYNEVGHTDESKKEIYGLFSRINNFITPKPTRLLKRILHISTAKDSLILDYFAGSGTTGHALINLNREDGGRRKYILVEMGEYFDTVTKPRIQKVIYTNNWKDGKPQDKTLPTSKKRMSTSR